MTTTDLALSHRRSIQWPRWTDAFDSGGDYLGLTSRILCGLYDGSCETCRCSDPNKSYYASSVRDLLPLVWPNGPMEMILQFNRFASMQNMPDNDKVRDPVSSAFAKLQEHAAFWTWVKSVMRSAGAGAPVETQPRHEKGRAYKVGEREGDVVVNYVSPSGMPGYSTTQGTIAGPAERPRTPLGQLHSEGNTSMSTDTVNPFGGAVPSNAPSSSPDIGEGTPVQPSSPPSTAALVVIAGLGVLFIGGIIAADMYRTSKGIRPVVVASPMMPMGVYY